MFSYFNYCTDKTSLGVNTFPLAIDFKKKALNSTTRDNKVLLRLEEEDQEPGRFWFKLIASLRTAQPGIGRGVLDGLVDHHSVPSLVALTSLSQELSQTGISLKIENESWVKNQTWWPAANNWLHQNLSDPQPDMHKKTQVNAAFVTLDQDLRNFTEKEIDWLFAWQPIWLEWFQELEPAGNLPFYLYEWGQRGFGLLLLEGCFLPVADFSQAVKAKNKTGHSSLTTRDQSAFTDWLAEKGEYLEQIRWMLRQKEFELAGELLEQKGESWLQQGIDPLELLFWLHEMPSVLLGAKPVLSWLAAHVCNELRLSFRVNYYCNAAENSLASFTHFTHDEKQWLEMEVNEAGLTVGDLMKRIKILRANN